VLGGFESVLGFLQDKTALQQNVEEVIEAAEIMAHQRAVQRYIDWQDLFYTPTVEALRSDIDEKASLMRKSRLKAYNEFLAATNKHQGVFLDAPASSKSSGTLKPTQHSVRVKLHALDPLKRQLTRKKVEQRLLETGLTEFQKHVQPDLHRSRTTLSPTQWEQKALRQTPYGRFGFRSTKNFVSNVRTGSNVLFDDFTSANRKSFDSAAVDAEFPRGIQTYKVKFKSHGIEHHSANVYQPEDRFQGSPRVPTKLSDMPER
jgi:hypothetical protein